MTPLAGLGEPLVDLARECLAAEALPASDAARRLNAIEWILQHGFPTRRDEEWRYFPLGTILTRNYGVPDLHAARDISTTLLDALVPDLAGPRLVMLNGHLAPDFSRLDGLSAEISVRQADPNAPTRQSGSCATDTADFLDFGHAFEALNSAMATSQVSICVAGGTQTEYPVHLVYLSVPTGRAILANPRVSVSAGPRSRVRLVESFLGMPGTGDLTNAVTTVHCDDAAQVDIVRVQDLVPGNDYISLLDVRQGPRSRFSCRTFVLGADVARHELRVRLCGEGASAFLEGLFLPHCDQHHDNPVFVEHAGPRTHSRQHYQGIIDGSGHGVFNGRIVVLPSATGADAEQASRNLLLSDRAEIDTRPRLEIFTDEVRCTHGAAVGRLDESALYYLRTRGIPRAQARSMLVHAVADDMVGRVRDDLLRADVQRRVAARIEDQEHRG